MPLIHHVITGNGQPPIVLVHGFACAHSDWDAQVAHLSPRHQTVTADLRGHGASPGTADESSIERYGADVAEVLRALELPPAVLVSHSMGCRVVVEAALQAPAHTAAVVLVDGSLSKVDMIATKTGRQDIQAVSACSTVFPAAVQARPNIHPGRTRIASDATA
jgi:pimeloyl-ACP methyl ester carboxylesterase